MKVLKFLFDRNFLLLKTTAKDKGKLVIEGGKMWKDFAYLAKLLKAADCGFMQSGTRPVCNCSAMNLCISSVGWSDGKDQ
jgi:hypothetical protein